MQKIINQLSEELGLNKQVVLNIYKAYWRFIKETIEGINFDNIHSKEDYKRMKVHFNIPNIGKLCCSYDRMNSIKNQIKYIEDAKHKKDKTNV